MPLNAIKYENTIIYKIVCNDLNIKDVYVGHTTDFRSRKNQHKCAITNSNNKKYNNKLYNTIRENKGWDNYSMIEIEKFPCNDRNEATKRERFWYEELNAKLNMINPNRSNKEWNKINYAIKSQEKEYKQKMCEKAKLYALKNKELVKEKRAKYHMRNQVKLNAKSKEYYEANKTKISSS